MSPPGVFQELSGKASRRRSRNEGQGSSILKCTHDIEGFPMKDSGEVTCAQKTWKKSWKEIGGWECIDYWRKVEGGRSGWGLTAIYT